MLPSQPSKHDNLGCDTMATGTCLWFLTEIVLWRRNRDTWYDRLKGFPGHEMILCKWLVFCQIFLEMFRFVVGFNSWYWWHKQLATTGVGNQPRLYVSQGKDHRVVRHPRHLVSTLTVSFDRRNLNHLFGGQDTLSCVICSFQHVAYYLSWIILLADKCSENSDGSICTVESHLQGEPLKSKIGWFSTDWRGRFKHLSLSTKKVPFKFIDFTHHLDSKHAG